MRLPTFKPNDIDYARLMREWELLDDRNKVLERENAALNHKLDEILTNKNYEGGVQFWINKHDEVLLREASLLAENAALRADIHAHEQINKQLIEDKRRLDWLLTDDGGFWVNWMYEKDEWTPELKASRDAIDACRNWRIGNRRQP